MGRHTKAIKHLHALDAHDELRAYAIKHVLYKDAIDLYKYQPEQLHDITNTYADYLHDESKYKEAGIGTFPLIDAERLYPYKSLLPSQTGC